VALLSPAVREFWTITHLDNESFFFGFAGDPYSFSGYLLTAHFFLKFCLFRVFASPFVLVFFLSPEAVHFPPSDLERFSPPRVFSSIRACSFGVPRVRSSPERILFPASGHSSLKRHPFTVPLLRGYPGSHLIFVVFFPPLRTWQGKKLLAPRDTSSAPSFPPFSVCLSLSSSSPDGRVVYFRDSLPCRNFLRAIRPFFYSPLGPSLLYVSFCVPLPRFFYSMPAVNRIYTFFSGSFLQGWRVPLWSSPPPLDPPS